MVERIAQVLFVVSLLATVAAVVIEAALMLLPPRK